MTVSALPLRDGPTAANGSQTVFQMTWVAASENDVEVHVTDSAGNTTIQTLDVDYTVQVSSQASIVTFLTAPASGSSVTFLSKVAYEQTVDLTTAGVVVLDTLQGVVDKLAKQVKQLEERLDRSVTFAVQTTKNGIVVATPAAADAGKQLTWDETNQEYTHTAQDTLGGASISSFGETVVAASNAAALQAILSLVPNTDVVRQATYDAHIADVDAHFGPVISEPPVSIVNSTTSTDTAFTTQTVSTNGSDVARFVILRVRLFINHATGAVGARDLQVSLRRNGSTSTGSSVQRVRCQLPATGTSSMDTAICDRTVIVPLDSSQRYQYAIDQTNGVGTNEIEIIQEGYIT